MTSFWVYPIYPSGLAGCLLYLLWGGIHFSSGKSRCWLMPYVRYRRTMFRSLVVGLKGEMPQDERVLCLAQNRGIGVGLAELTTGAEKGDILQLHISLCWMISWVAGDIGDIFHPYYSILFHAIPSYHSTLPQRYGLSQDDGMATKTDASLTWFPLSFDWVWMICNELH